MAMHSELVTVIIPCFNAEAYIAQAIESALAQTYQSIEIIVIDDGSSDRSVEVIRSFSDVVRWETGPNRGACAARNRGVTLAKGTMIQFLDADDLLMPLKLERQVPLLLRNPGCSVFSHVAHREGTADEVLEVYSPRETNTIRRCCFDKIQTSAPLHWKQSLRKIGGFDADLPCAQEFDLHLRLACTGVKFVEIPEILATHRRVPNSLSSDYVKVLLQYEKIVPRAATILQQSNSGSPEDFRSLAEALALAGIRLADRGHKNKLTDYAILAHRIHASAGISRFAGVRGFAYRTLGLPLGHRLLSVISALRFSMKALTA